MASHHQPGNVVPLEELLAVVKAARALLAELHSWKPERQFMTVARADLRTALTNLDRINP